MKRGNAKVLRTAIAMCAVAASFLAPAPAISGSGNTKPIAVVAMGDSLASGQAGRWMGNSASRSGNHDGTDRAYFSGSDFINDDEAPTRIYGDSYYNNCFRSDVAPIMNTRLSSLSHDKIHRFNLACSGASTINIKRKKNGGEPWKGENPQIDQLVEIVNTHKVKLISLSVGGNDVNFSELASMCTSSYVYNGEYCKVEGQTLIDSRISWAIVQVGQAIQDIREVMRSANYPDDSYRLVLNSVPPMIPRADDNRYPEAGWSRVLTGGCPIWDEDLNWINDSLDTLTGNLEALAFVTQTDFLNLRPAFEGREACSKRSQQVTSSSPPDGKIHEWARFLTTGYGQGDVDESFHPNYFGQQAIAECLTQVLALPGPAGFVCSSQDGQDQQKRKGPKDVEVKEILRYPKTKPFIIN